MSQEPGLVGEGHVRSVVVDFVLFEFEAIDFIWLSLWLITTINAKKALR